MFMDGQHLLDSEILKRCLVENLQETATACRGSVSGTDCESTPDAFADRLTFALHPETADGVRLKKGVDT